MKSIRCILKQGREKVLEAQHPWVFSGSIEDIDANYETGDLVRVFSSSDRFLGIGYLNPRSHIAIRMLTFDDIPIQEAFFEKRIQRAVEMRSDYLTPETNAYRLINSEGDFLPGLIVDRYADYLVVQILTAGMEKWKDVIVSILNRKVSCLGIFEKNDFEIRGEEGLAERIGKLAGEEPPDYIEIIENGCRFVVDIHGGQRTGFYLDQRAGRARVGFLSRGKRVLNCFAYTGAFSVYAAQGGASETVSVETSEAALNTARVNFEKNGLSQETAQFVNEDVFAYLKDTRQEFDLVVLDPPELCRNKQQVAKALKDCRELNLNALKRLGSGGVLVTYLSSSYISREEFERAVAESARQARVPIKVLKKTAHDYDHPVDLHHPEGEYLKGLVCEVG